MHGRRLGNGNFEWLSENQARDASCWCAQATTCMGKAFGGTVHLQELTAPIVKAWMDKGAVRVSQKACMDGTNDRMELYGSAAFVRAEGHMKRTYAKWFWHAAPKARECNIRCCARS